MDSVSTLRSAVEDVIRLTRQVETLARNESLKAKSRSHQLDRRKAESAENAAEAKAYARLMGRVLWIPMLRGAIITRYQLRADKAVEEAETLRYRAADAMRRSDDLSTHADRSQKLLERLIKAGRAAPQLGQVPKKTEEDAVDCWSRVRFLMAARRNVNWIEQSLAEADCFIALVRDWAKIKADAAARNAAPVSRPAVMRRPARKIYLPIPSSMAPIARDLGARQEKGEAPWISEWYVSTNDDLSKFRNLLPLAYRPQATQFEFPPVPYRASGQNLWTFFDSTWDRIRKASYSMTGHRCAICGNRGGFISDKVLGANEKRHGVDCHEVWDWSVDDPATGVGVQKLKRLLVVCPSCHATFHSGYFTSRAKELGIGDEVETFIDKRRMLINRMSPEELQVSLDESRAALQSVKDVDTWIIDLEILGQQQFMADHTAVLKERNSAGVPPERIAGMAFETDVGEYFPLRSAEDIYNELLENDLTSTGTMARV